MICAAMQSADCRRFTALIGRRRLWLAVFAVVALWGTSASAHELQPALLEITELTAGRYEIRFRTPLVQGARHPVRLVLPALCTDVMQPTLKNLANATVQHLLVQVEGGDLDGQRIHFEKLQTTRTDVLVRTSLADGTQWTLIVRPSQPWLDFTGSMATAEVARAYTLHGVQHILYGVDHLLFVFGLLLIVSRRWMLIKTITAFTVAHSITLAIATLGAVQVAPGPLNACIALSILFLGPEIVKSWRGESSLTLRHPWLVAFLFGLLHGFGFASALIDAGLPRSVLPLALLTFNVGVEIGQLAFVAMILLLMRSLRQLQFIWSNWAYKIPGYTVGSLGALWTIQRVVALFEGRG